MGLFGKRKPKPLETTHPALRLKTGTDKDAMAALRSASGSGRAGAAGSQSERKPFPSESFEAALLLGEVKENLSPEWSKMCADPLRELDTDARMTALAMYIIQHGQECWTHVMLPDQGTASNYEHRFQRLFNGIFSVTRVAIDCTPSRGKVTVGTYEEFEAAGTRLERDLSAASGYKVLGIAIDPAVGFTPGGHPLSFTRHCTRLIEV
jgi:hypothetical protein